MSRASDVEFVRSAYGLLPEPGDRDPGTATWMPSAPGSGPSASRGPWRSCTCSTAKRKMCRHRRTLERLVGELRGPEATDAAERFAASFWYKLTDVLLAGEPAPVTGVRHLPAGEDGSARSHAFVRGGQELARWLDDSSAAARLVARVTGDRAALLERLGLIVATESERALNKAGHLSHRQLREASFWGRLTYHCFREHDDPTGRFRPAIEQASGEFTLSYHDRLGVAVVRIVVPRSQVRALLELLITEFPGQPGLAICPVPLRSIFEVNESTALDVEVRPMIEVLQASGERRFFDRADLERFTYGTLVYVPELGLLAELERAGRERTFRAPVAMKLARSQVPQFLERHRAAIEEGSMVAGPSREPLAPIERPDRITIGVASVPSSDLGWYELSVTYGFGSHDVSLDELLRSRSEGQTFLGTPAGWVDLQAPFFRRLGALGRRGEAEGGAMKLSAAELLRLTLAAGMPVEIEGLGESADRLRDLVAMRPSAPCGELSGLSTPLRSYQRVGLDWCRVLFEHRLGGLLCDDMGLGKTHQAMAFMVWLREEAGIRAPFLVVCPTTVLSHWRDKLRDHAPGLRAEIYHGSGRESLDPAAADLVVTSYGVLRNDVERLAAIPFALAVFDEIQQIKNPSTAGYQAAAALGAPLKLGLTGTPVENSLDELKALFDLVLPGWLGGTAAFQREFGTGADGPRGDRKLDELRALIAPFVLRRVKAAVLDELPEKTEDVRTCRLSDDQVKLYRDALATRGRPVVERLQTASEKEIPYLHVFALLTLLKQICDHPALVLETRSAPEEAHRYRSGKWELFQELLFESLDSGHKVVVFTQFLGMIRMMERLLEGLDIGHVSLTGGTRDRGARIRTFSDDPACRVFLGSLKAGGTGIDLVAASVVIHYDRWWNAAREDQATDRAHRIGQTRGLQVFKLVTEGTLEERISAIIERKRRLMDAVVRASDPKLSKAFTRDELLELLRPI